MPKGARLLSSMPQQWAVEQKGTGREGAAHVPGRPAHVRGGTTHARTAGRVGKKSTHTLEIIHADVYDQHVKKKARKRCDGGGQTPRLAAMEDTLCFLLLQSLFPPGSAGMAL